MRDVSISHQVSELSLVIDELEQKTTWWPQIASGTWTVNRVGDTEACSKVCLLRIHSYKEQLGETAGEEMDSV